VTGFELEARVSGWKRSASAFGQLGQLPESLSTSIDNWRSLGHFRRAYRLEQPFTGGVPGIAWLPREVLQRVQTSTEVVGRAASKSTRIGYRSAAHGAEAPQADRHRRRTASRTGRRALLPRWPGSDRHES
jgi:hypothetical protein